MERLPASQVWAEQLNGSEWMLGDFFRDGTPSPDRWGVSFMVLDCDPHQQAGEENLRIESSPTRCSWLICGIILCKIHPKGWGWQLLETHCWALWTGGCPALLSVCSSPFWLSLMFCAFWWKHITHDPGYQVLRWKFSYVLFFSFLNSSHALQQCPSLRRGGGKLPVCVGRRGPMEP